VSYKKIGKKKKKCRNALIAKKCQNGTVSRRNAKKRLQMAEGSLFTTCLMLFARIVIFNLIPKY